MRPAFVLVCILFFGVGCSTTQTIPESESPGAKVYVKTCTKCHGLPGPTRHTAEQWDNIIVMMNGFMDQRGITFPEADKQLIRDYLRRNAR
ncbi:MAG: cytochrome c [Nitrospinota bacterium]